MLLRSFLSSCDLQAIQNNCNSNTKVEFEGKIVDVKCVVIMSVKVKKGKLEVQYAVSEAGKLQLAKRSSKAKGGGGSKGGGSKGSKGGKGKSKNREVKMTIQPKSICQIAIADVVAETIACLKKSGVALPEGKALEDVKSKLESAILPSMLTFQNVIYSEGANSTRGVAPDYNLFDKKG